MEPTVTSDIIAIGEAIAAPGQVVEIPVLLSNEVEIEAVQLILSYDPSLLEPFGQLSYSGSYYEYLDEDAQGELRLVRSVAPGVLAVAFMPNFFYDDDAVPPGDDRLIFSILAKVSESAEPGAVIDLVPTNGPEGEGTGPYRLRNELTHIGQARFIATLPETLPGRLQIVGDLAVFVRGDSNGDDVLDISDASHTLGYLFSGSNALECEDAAERSVS